MRILRSINIYISNCKKFVYMCVSYFQDKLITCRLQNIEYVYSFYIDTCYIYYVVTVGFNFIYYLFIVHTISRRTRLIGRTLRHCNMLKVIVERIFQGNRYLGRPRLQDIQQIMDHVNCGIYVELKRKTRVEQIGGLSQTNLWIEY